MSPPFWLWDQALTQSTRSFIEVTLGWVYACTLYQWKFVLCSDACELYIFRMCESLTLPRASECIFMEVYPPPMPYQVCKIEELRKASSLCPIHTHTYVHARVHTHYACTSTCTSKTHHACNAILYVLSVPMQSFRQYVPPRFPRAYTCALSTCR